MKKLNFGIGVALMGTSIVIVLYSLINNMQFVFAWGAITGIFAAINITVGLEKGEDVNDALPKV